MFRLSLKFTIAIGINKFKFFVWNYMLNNLVSNNFDSDNAIGTATAAAAVGYNK